MRIINNSKKKSIGKKIVGFLIFIVVLVVIYLVAIWGVKTFIYPTTHMDIVSKEAAKNNVDPYLVLAIIKTESGFKKNAISNKEAKGLMQIMDATAKDINNDLNLADEINNTNIYDEEINIALGCKYFSSLIKKYNGNYYLAICAYNAGMGNVDKWISQDIINENLDEYKNVSLPFKQSSKYLDKVVSSYKMYKFLYK